MSTPTLATTAPRNRRRDSPAHQAALRAVAIVAIAALGVAVALASEGSSSAGDEPQAQVVAASDNLNISDSLSGGAIVTATELGPGHEFSGDVTIGNAGTIPGAFSLSASDFNNTPGPNGGALSAALDLRVEDLTMGTVVYNGKLESLGQRSLGVWQPNQSHDFRLTARLPDNGAPLTDTTGDNLYQTASTSFQFDWTATEAPAGGGEDGGTGGGGTTPGADRGDGSKVARLQVSVAGKPQRLRRRKVSWTVSCNVACAIQTGAAVYKQRGMRGKPKMLFRPRIKSTSLRATVATTVTLTFNRKQTRRIRRALRKRYRVKLVVKATATTDGGATSTNTATIKIKR